jgi:uncharacterized membrane protein
VSLPPPTHDSGVVPNAGEFGIAWIVYALFGFGIFLWWPALFAVLVCHLRAGSPAVGFLASHYRWLARTFWLSLAGYVLAFGIILAGAWPLARDVLAQVRQHGDWSVSTSFGFAWSSMFATVGAATLGGLLLLGAWCWFIYRVVRGAVRLADSQAV